MARGADTSAPPGAGMPQSQQGGLYNTQAPGGGAFPMPGMFGAVPQFMQQKMQQQGQPNLGAQPQQPQQSGQPQQPPKPNFGAFRFGRF